MAQRPEDVLNEALDDLATGDHVVVILIRSDDPVLTHDVRWSDGLSMMDLMEIPNEIEETMASLEAVS